MPTETMPINKISDRHSRAVLRIVLSYYVANGLSAALGLLLISGGIHFVWGSFASAAASVGVLVCIPPDQPAPQRGKFWQLLPAALVGLPLFFAVQVLHNSPLYLGLLLVPATFIAFLGAAWGKRGLPISVSVMFAMIFSMAVPHTAGIEAAFENSMYFALGAGFYLVYATLANSLLNARYRVQMLADTLLSLADLLHTQAQQFTPARQFTIDSNLREPILGQILKQQTALADQLQIARDIVLEAPRTPARQRLAGMLIQVLEMRDHLLVCELDLEVLQSHKGHIPLLAELRKILDVMADEIAQLADDLLRGRQPTQIENRRPQLAALHWNQPVEVNAPPVVLARGLAGRVGLINDEAVRLVALARGESEPNLTVVHSAWQMFVSPISWSWKPLIAIWGWDAPPLRHAIRAALAVGAAYGLALVLPWGTHEYWILVTIVVVLRGSLAQTLERRNSRIIGTLVGSMLASAILYLHPSAILLLIIMTLAQAFAHAFSVKRYLVTAVSATILGLLQAHLLAAGTSPAFEILERIADTLIGVVIAWPFSYLLPSWERTQIPALVTRVLTAQARHSKIALQLGHTQPADNKPEIEWRLARREAYNSLSALAQAAQRSIAEPRAVRPPLESLEHLIAHSYQLLGQLTAVKTMLLMRRERLQLDRIALALTSTAEKIETTLVENIEVKLIKSSEPILASAQLVTTATISEINSSVMLETLTDPFEQDLSPWLLRRLTLAANIATQLRNDAEKIRSAPSM